MLRVGLTGGLASGKSSLARLLEGEGAASRDADDVVRELYAPKAPGSLAVVRRFGTGVLAADGSVDAAALGRLVLNDPEERHRLEEVIHPLVRGELKRWLDVVETRDPPPMVAVVEAALLVESGAFRNYHRLVVVSAAEELRFERAVRSGWPADRVKGVLAAQLRDDERQSMADYVVHNEGSKEELKVAAQHLWLDLLADATLLADGRPLPDRRSPD